jgi:hypothetical protein
MRNLVFILIAFIAAVTFIRAYDNSSNASGVSEAAIKNPAAEQRGMDPGFPITLNGDN